MSHKQIQGESQPVLKVWVVPFIQLAWDYWLLKYVWFGHLIILRILVCQSVEGLGREKGQGRWRVADTGLVKKGTVLSVRFLSFVGIIKAWF